MSGRRLWIRKWTTNNRSQRGRINTHELLHYEARSWLLLLLLLPMMLIFLLPIMLLLALLSGTTDMAADSFCYKMVTNRKTLQMECASGKKTSVRAQPTTFLFVLIEARIFPLRDMTRTCVQTINIAVLAKTNLAFGRRKCLVKKNESRPVGSWQGGQTKCQEMKNGSCFFPEKIPGIRDMRHAR